jgi:hypothetical protein
MFKINDIDEFEIRLQETYEACLIMTESLDNIEQRINYIDKTCKLTCTHQDTHILVACERNLSKMGTVKINKNEPLSIKKSCIIL